MTQTIDNKVVEMAFENSSFEKNVSTSIGTIDRLKRSLNFGNVGKSFDEISASAGRVNMNPIADGIGAIAGKFSALSVIGITALVNLTNSALEAGKRIATALVIDPIKTGLNEYETKLNSVQTILANTQKEGTTLKVVTDALNQLNEYSDKTIYNFQQMTRNVGTFTAAGIDLKTSVASIKGIANLAAISGSNAEQASSAMYQLSQALSTGTVRLMDWNSVVSAGMGGQIFQDALVDTARVHGIAVDQIIKDEGGFRNSLQKGWLTSKVLSETLQKFTGDLNADQLRTMGYSEEQIASIIKMGQTANDAATKVKTFTQLFDTLKEAAQSGWAQTWEIVIGDFEEAKSFLTDLNAWFGGILGATADARNELLTGWKDLGGRKALLESVKNVLNAIVKVVEPIHQAFKDIFPATTAQQLYTLSLNLRLFTQNLQISGSTAEKLKRLFKGVFAIFDIGKMAVLAIAKEFKRLLSFLSPIPGGVLDILASFGDWLVTVRDMIKNNDTFGKVMKTVGDAILAVASVIGMGINAIMGAVRRFKELNTTEGIFKAFSGAVASFFSYFKNLDFSVFNGFVDRVKARFAPLAKLGEIIKNSLGKAVSATNPFREKLLTIAKNIRDAIGKFVLSVLDKLSRVDFSNFDFKGMFDGLNAGLLGGLLIAITKFVGKGTGIFSSVVDIFKGISGFAENANGILASITTLMTGVKDILTAWQQQVRAGILIKIASAIAILAGSLLVLSLIDSKKLTIALAAVTGLFADLLGALAVYEKVSGSSGIPAMAKAIGAMLGLSAAILLLSLALAKIATIPSEDIVRSIAAIGALTAMLVTTSLILSKNSVGALKGIGSLILFSLAIRSLIGPIKSLGSMDTDAMVRGLAGLAAMLTEISIFLKLMNFKMADLDDVVGLLVLSGAIATLSLVIKQLGSLDQSTLTQGLTVLGILLTGLAGFTRAASGGSLFLITSAGILVMSGAMVILADVLKKIGSMNMDQLTIALTGLGGALLILGVAMTAMQGSIVGAGAVLVAALALAVLVPPLKAISSLSLEQVGIGLLALAGAFTVLGLAGLVLGPTIPVLAALALTVGLFGVAVLAAGVGVGILASGLALLATVGAAGGAAVAAALLAIAVVLPALATAAAVGIINFAKTIAGGAPAIFKAGTALLLGFINAVASTMPQIIELVLGYLSGLLVAIAEKAPELISTGSSIVFAFLTGMKNNIGGFTTAAIDIMTNFLKALASRIPEIVDSGWNLIIAWIDGIKDAVEAHLPDLIDSVRELGWAIIKGVAVGIIEGREDAKKNIMELGQLIIDAFKEKLGIHSPSTVFAQLALDLLNGLANGIKNNIYLAINEIIKLGTKIIEKIKSSLSTITNVGRDFVQGLANGVKNNVGLIFDTVVQMAADIIKRLRDALKSQSPSKETMDIGQDIDLGLAIGITKFSGVVSSAITTLGTDTVRGFGDVISKITSAVNNMEASPVIRPVIDLSEIEAGSSAIQSIFGGKQLNLSVATVRASAISVPGQTSTDALAAQQNSNPTISFVQYNNSPKALPRDEIYRLTNNQLVQFKKRIGAND